VISLIVSLTLSPAMCALLLRSHDEDRRQRWWELPIRGFFTAFNWGFDRLGRGYGLLAGRVVRFAALTLLAYVAVLTSSALSIRDRHRISGNGGSTEGERPPPRRIIMSYFSTVN
jgi:multidrug efflux pump subunit AcrB